MDPTPAQTTTRDLSVSYTKATILGTLFPLPFIVLFVLLYVLLWGTGPVKAVLNGYWAAPIFFGLIVAGSIVHELIHGFTFSIAGKKPFSVIRFGFHWQTLSPYANCTVPLDARAYKLGGCMPFLLEGILPSFLAVLTGSAWLLLFGAIFILGAGGDLLIMWTVRNIEPDVLVLDHPTRVGCSVLVPEKRDGSAGA